MRRFGVRSATAAAEVITFELVNSRINVSGTSLDYPTGKQAGDLCVVLYGKSNGSTSIPSAYSITGFSAHTSQTDQLASPSPGTAVRLGVLSRILDGSEGNTWSGGSGPARVSAFLFRPSKPLVSRAWSGAGETGSGFNFGGGNWSGLSRPFVAVGFSYSASGLFRGFDSAANLTILSSVAAYGIYDSEDADIPSSINPATAGGSYAMASIFGRFTFTF